MSGIGRECHALRIHRRDIHGQGLENAKGSDADRDRRPDPHPTWRRERYTLLPSPSGVVPERTKAGLDKVHNVSRAGSARNRDSVMLAHVIWGISVIGPFHNIGQDRH